MKKVLISIFTLIFIISMVTVVNAASGSISLTASPKQVVKGNTFTITVAGAADENITALQSALSYDTTKLSLESKVAGTGFTDASGSDSEIAVLSTDNNSLSTSGTLYTLTFKVLDTAEEGDTTISVTSATLALINASGEQENVSVEDGSATVTIKTDDTTIDRNAGSIDSSTDDETGSGSSSSTSSNGSDKTGSSSSSSSASGASGASGSDTSSSKKTTLPQTGVEVVSIIAIAVLSVFAAISYVSYKKYKNI